jgi:protein-tyrosine-phosphatase
MKKILFVCVHNSGRSQMAEAFFNAFSKGKGLAISAGTRPAKQINPLVVKVMKEFGLDISGQKPRLLTVTMLKEADVVITMGCNPAEVCPISFTLARDWDFPDPQGKSTIEVRRIRDEIEGKVRELIDEI